MSQRGSFVTEYIYCEKCFKAAKGVLLERNKYLCSIVLPNLDAGREMPIIAGKIGSFSSEAYDMRCEIAPELAKVICHPIRIAVLEEGEADVKAITIVVMPTQEEVE